jgi:hypothetical protein
MRKLGEGHCQKLFPTTEFSDAMITVVTLNAPVELVVGKAFNDLSENGSTAVHRTLLQSSEGPLNLTKFKSFKSFFAVIPWRDSTWELFQSA